MKTAKERARLCVEKFEGETLSLTRYEGDALCDMVELFLREQDKLTRYATAQKMSEMSLPLECIRDHRGDFIPERAAYRIVMSIDAV